MTTKTYSNTFIEDDSLSDEEEGNAEFGNSRWNMDVESGDQDNVTTTPIVSIFGSIKDSAYHSYYSCFMENATFADFSTMIDGGEKRKGKKRGGLIMSKFNKHDGDFKKWFVGHEAILNEIFDRLLFDVCSYEKWAQFAYLTSSKCGCYDIERCAGVDI